MSKLLVLTPIYPAKDIPEASTPVVHYFTREWVKMGHEVGVIHYAVNLPTILFILARPLENILSSYFGCTIRTKKVKETTYELDGVLVKRIPMEKIFPHSRYNKKEVERAFNKTIEYCEGKSFIPDVIVAHWLNPQVEFLPKLKQKWNCTTCLVMHDAGIDFKTIFASDVDSIMDNVDVIGFRSKAIKNKFLESFHYIKPSFLCYSGIPKEFIDGFSLQRNFGTVHSFVFVGTLIKRKFPAQIIDSLVKSYPDKDFSIQYIGTGDESKSIKKRIKAYQLSEGQVILKGRMQRKEVSEILKVVDVFVMISRNETFGLVYLEAMAAGCITIASKDEGFDGIIEHGRNGFLCKAGDIEDLTRIINEIKSLPKDMLIKISNAAKETADRITDDKVANYYLNNILGRKCCEY